MAIELNGKPASQEQIDALGAELSAGKGVGALAAQVGKGLGNIGLHLIPGGGRVANVNGGFPNTTDVTDELLVSVPSPQVYAVRPIFVIGGAGVAVTMNAGIRAVPDASTASAASALHRTVTVGGATTWTMTPAATLGRRRYVMGDILPIPQVARTDGGSGSLFVIRAHRTAGNMVVIGNTSSTPDLTGWANPANVGSAIYRMRSISFGSDYANSALWNSNPDLGSNVSTGSIAGLQFYSLGKVANVVGDGDSLTDGAGATVFGNGWGPRAVASLNSMGLPATFSWANLGYSGCTYNQARINLEDALAQGIIPPQSVVAFPNSSPNTIGNRTIADADIVGGAGTVVGSTIQSEMALMFSALASSGLRLDPILWTWMPTNSSVNNYGTSDSLRRAWNDLARQMAQRGSTLADFDAVIAGLTVSGQVQMNAALQADGIHPNDAGYAALAAAMVKAILRVLATPTGFLAT